jgi:hypothetical protein
MGLIDEKSRATLPLIKSFFVLIYAAGRNVRANTRPLSLKRSLLGLVVQ